MTGSLKCTTPGEIFLLLKSSDAIASNFSRAFDCCVDVNGGEGRGDEESEKPSYDLYLILRRWCKLLPSREFRCFVHQNVLIAISQRDSANFYPHLLEEKENIHDHIDTFFMNNIKGKFAQSDFVFDIYIDQKNKVYLMDFGVYSVDTDALLFDWSEIHELTASRLAASDVDDEIECEFRIVESSGGILPSDQCYFGLPKDMLDISSPGGLSKFIEMTKNLTHDDDSSSEEEEGEGEGKSRRK
jgi:hypothetical protein